MESLFADLIPKQDDYAPDPYDDLADNANMVADDDYAKQQDQMLRGLIYELEDRKERAVRHKSAIESRWIQDERQYWGLRTADILDEADQGEEPPPVDNKTGEKVELAAARIGDMLFPTNDHNWDYKPPEHAEDIDGKPVDAERARHAVRAIRGKVRGYLNESQYAKHGRRAIHDACRLGVGVLKGPYPSLSTKRVMRRQKQVVVDPMTGIPTEQQNLALVIRQSTVPAATRVDPWMFFALPCRSMEECNGAFEMHKYPYEGLVRLAKQPGFDPDAIRKVAEQPPSHSDNESTLLETRDKLLNSSNDEDRHEEYIVWEYHGPLEPTLLERLGAIQAGTVDPLQTFWGEVWFCQGVAIKTQISDVIGDERVPYYVVPYRRDDGDIMSSYGIPRIMHDDQRVIDITWEAMVHNTKLTAGPQTLIMQGKAAPQDGNYVVKGPKTWVATDPKAKTPSDVIKFENLQSSMTNIQPLYEFAKQNANDSTQLPMLAHGEAANQVQQTASGLQMVMNAQNVVQRKFAHQWDDEVTIPLMTRFYWWEMQYGDDDENKIDMTVDPRGASYLMVKDVQAQHTLVALQMVEQHPGLRHRVHMDRLYELAFGCMDLPTERLLKTDEEMQSAEPTPEETMQSEMMQAELAIKQGEAAEAQANAAEASAKVDIMRRNGGIDPDTIFQLERESIQAESASEKIQGELLIAQMKRDERMAELAMQERTSLADIQARMESGEKDRQVKAMLEAAKNDRERKRDDRKALMDGMKLRVDMKREQTRDENQEAGFDSIG